MDRFNKFKMALTVGEKVLDFHCTDYQDAYNYSLRSHSMNSESFVEHFSNQKEPYVLDLLRYIFIKAIEWQVSSDLYANTTRGNVCDIFISPDDIFLDKYPTNLPKCLENAINEYQPVGSVLATELSNAISLSGYSTLDIDVLNAVQFLGQTIGNKVSQENAQYKEYHTADMLTRNELNQIAGENFCNWLENNGFEITDTNFTRDTYQNIISQQGQNTLFILMSAEIAPVSPGFLSIDLNNLCKCALESHAIPCYASISMGAVDEKHFQDGIILYGDKCRFRVNAFDQLGEGG